VLARQYGFERVAQGRPQKWIAGAHVKSLLNYKFDSMWGGRWLKALLQLIPDGLRLPYPAEDLFWMLFRKV
jgi:hypothetical protein